jgi:hypothetical protein
MVHAMTFGESMRALMAERRISLRKLASLTSMFLEAGWVA